jgi:hypothetical protein
MTRLTTNSFTLLVPRVGTPPAWGQSEGAKSRSCGTYTSMSHAGMHTYDS